MPPASHERHMHRCTSYLLIGSLLASAATGARAQSSHSFGVFDAKSGRFAPFFSDQSRRPPDTLALSSARAWTALTLVYEQFGIALTIADTESHVLGAIRVTQHRLVGGQRLSRILECGTGQFGPNADRYSVQLSALSAVEQIDSLHVAITTRVGGDASQNASTAHVACSTTRVLEERIADEMKKLIGG